MIKNNSPKKETEGEEKKEEEERGGEGERQGRKGDIYNKDDEDRESGGKKRN